ncbi:MAG: trypsin-like peptidase domain-containing protein [Methanobrevibacter sp.]|nr:trypsin-like peptidase domain-containing protein [Methanobrevibacter sp.]
MNKPEVGEKVFAIGSPRGLENTFSSGEISQWRSNEVIQTNVQIDHGSSGGPLINQYGQVVGITSGTFYDGSQANLNYAWSIDVIKSVLQ